MSNAPKPAIAPPFPGIVGNAIVWIDARFPLVNDRAAQCN